MKYSHRLSRIPLVENAVSVLLAIQWVNLRINIGEKMEDTKEPGAHRQSVKRKRLIKKPKKLGEWRDTVAK